MELTTCYLPSAGGGRLFCRLWTPDAEPIAVLQIVHGLSEHSGRYELLAQYLAEHGFAVAAADQMGHGRSDGAPGCFTGGWWTAVEDVRRVLWRCRLRWPDTPLFLLGHSMGSFVVRTLLIDQPALPLTGVLLSGTAQYPRLGTAALGALMSVNAALRGAQTSGGAAALTERLFSMPFLSEHSEASWISSDARERAAVRQDPLCSVPPALGLQRDMLRGVAYNERPANLAKMRPTLPILFFSGDRDPVGMMGRGVLAAAESFRRAGMQQVTVRLYGGARHETLHEYLRSRVFADVEKWMREQMQTE